MTPSEDSLQKQLEERIRFETLLADLSARFVGLPAEALDREIQEAQRRICETLGLDRSTLGQPSEAGEPQFTHSWAIPGCTPVPRTLLTQLCPWGTQQILSGHTIRFSSLEELPPEAVADKEVFRRWGIKSNVSFPLIVGGKVMGGCRLGPSRLNGSGPKVWSTASG